MRVAKNRLRHAGWVLLGLFALEGAWSQAAVQQSASGSPQKVRLSPMIDKLAQGGVVRGHERQLDDPARAGLDFDWIEMEHGPYLIDQVRAIFEQYSHGKKPNGQLEMTPVVRIPTEGDEIVDWIPKQILDLGGLGIVFPFVETKEQATKAIGAMRFRHQDGFPNPLEPPGHRGYRHLSSGRMWGPVSPADYIRRADLWPLNLEGELFAVIMIESPRGIANINEILDVPGIGALFIGPSDLSASMGLAPLPPGGNPKHEAAIQTVLKACLAHKVVCGIPGNFGGKTAEQRIQEGFRFILQ